MFTVKIDMRVVKLVYIVLAQAYYRWAMREINPTHPDVPRIMHRQLALAEKRRTLWR